MFFNESVIKVTPLEIEVCVGFLQLSMLLYALCCLETMDLFASQCKVDGIGRAQIFENELDSFNWNLQQVCCSRERHLRYVMRGDTSF